MLISKKGMPALGIWMRLKAIAGRLRARKSLNRPALHTQKLYDPNAGIDSGSRSSSGTQLASGIPHKARHRDFLGVKVPGNNI